MYNFFQTISKVYGTDTNIETSAFTHLSYVCLYNNNTVSACFRHATYSNTTYYAAP